MVGARCVLATAAVRCGDSSACVSAPLKVTRSAAIITSAAPVGIRVGGWAAPAGEIRTWLTTAPPFCASPVMSSVDTKAPSRWAAVPSSWATVTTPVPPMPATTTLAVTRFGIGVGSRLFRASAIRASGVSRLGSAPVTVTNAGQNPPKQDRSLLQAL